MPARVEIFYSLQSDYCHFLLDRLFGLADQGGEVVVRPVLRGVSRLSVKNNCDLPQKRLTGEEIPTC